MAIPAFDAIAGIGTKIFSIVNPMVADRDQLAKLKHELQNTPAEFNQV